MTEKQPTPKEIVLQSKQFADQELLETFPSALKPLLIVCLLYTGYMGYSTDETWKAGGSQLYVLFPIFSGLITLILMLILILYKKLQKKRRHFLKTIGTLIPVFSCTLIFEGHIVGCVKCTKPLGSNGAFFIGFILFFLFWTFIAFVSDWRLRCVLMTSFYIYTAMRAFSKDLGYHLLPTFGMLILINFEIYSKEQQKLKLIQAVMASKTHNYEWKNLVKIHFKTPLAILDTNLKPKFYNEEMGAKFGFKSENKAECGHQIVEILQNIKLNNPDFDMNTGKLGNHQHPQNFLTNTEGDTLPSISLYDLMFSAYLNSRTITELKVPDAIVNIKDNGMHLEVNIRAIPWKQKTCYMILFTDTTIHVLNSKLKELNLYKDTLLATVSHDLRSPLNAIIGTIEGIDLDPAFPGSLKGELEVAKNGCSFLMLLINDILDFCQLQNSDLRLTFMKADLKKILQDTLALVKLQAKMKHIELQLEVEEGVSNEIFTDPNRLKQILVNLLTNAIKFTNAGFVKICLNKTEYNGRPFFMFSIQDTGVGIQEKDIPKLFKLYGKLRQEDENINKHGIGLGLKICQDLLKKLNTCQNNEFIVESEYGKGSIFRFCLPHESFNHLEEVKSRSQDEMGTAWDNISTITLDNKKGAIPSSPRRKFFESLKTRVDQSITQSDLICNETIRPLLTPSKRQGEILIVDDDAYCVAALRSLLGRLGYKATGVFSGTSAIQELTNSPRKYSVVLLDCHMPGLDGIETAKIIREKTKNDEVDDVTVIGLTGVTTEAEQSRCREAGMDDILIKPVTKSVIQIKLLQYLKNFD